jgi:hypothetical protein
MILQLDGTISEKEKLLATFKETQSKWQNELVDLMKNQYNKEVLKLTNDLTELQKEKSQSLDKGQMS